ncbi:hypothetical protein E2C01_052607 [Portunus trituberculatus]|uniref:Uncharacterized protein n=1 Tax=Portunus trituberculatus TaxID=210409 RepID=A0A5B7GE61_PORTR|nr:hypothetical protein [Portunus trituberculatus]
MRYIENELACQQVVGFPYLPKMNLPSLEQRSQPDRGVPADRRNTVSSATPQHNNNTLARRWMCVARRASANGRRGAVGEKMAASEEESGQSDSKNDDSATHETSKQFSTIHQVS